MKIMITGNMGYIGPCVAEHLRAVVPEAELIGVDTCFFGQCLTGADALPERLYDVQHFMDIRNLSDEIFNGVDVVINLAAISNDPMGKAYESVTKEINFEACIDLATKAKAAGVKRFVFASSCSVYGFAEGAAQSEESELNPLTAYAKSKINSENVLRDMADEDFVITSLRFPTACGMSDRLRLDLVLNDFVAAAVSSNKITILSDGTPWRPLIDIKDMARAMEWAMSRPLAGGGTFLAVNVGRNEWNYQVKDLAEAVREIMPGVDIEINPDAQPDKRSYQVDFSLYRELAKDYLPQVDLKQSITELVEGLEKMRFATPDFRNSHFMRLKVLANLRERGLLNEQLKWISRISAGESNMDNARIRVSGGA